MEACDLKSCQVLSPQSFGLAESWNAVLPLLEWCNYTLMDATTLKSNAVVAFAAHVVILPLTKDFKMFLVDHGYTPVALLSVSSALKDDDKDNSKQQATRISLVLPLRDDMVSLLVGHGHYVRLEVLHKLIRKILNPLRTHVYMTSIISLSDMT